MPKSEAQTSALGRSTDRPDLSVVIASVNGAAYLDACLASLTHQRGSIRSEIVVADRVGDEIRDLIDRRYPGVTLLSLPASATIPRLRSVGIAHSSGRIVAITEDHCVPAEDWLERILAAHRSPHAAIGGAVENASTTRLIDWAVYLCEYHRHTSPTREGVTDDIPGMNVAYKREALAQLQDLLEAERWESFLHARLRERGYTLYLDPKILVYHRKSFTLGGFLIERYHYARAFAGMRAADRSLAYRLFHAVGSPALPALLLGRMASQLFRRGRHRALFVRALPLIAAFTLSWATGEGVGYLSGPGDSLVKVT